MKTVKKPEGILSCFPGTPRPGQVDVLLQIEKNWKDVDVFVLNLPVAFGKSLISFTIARWAHVIHKKKSTISVPTNLLVDQMQDTFPRLFTIRSKAFYPCLMKNVENCLQCPIKTGDPKCFNCPYLKAVKQARIVPYLVGNSYSTLALKLNNKVMIWDEAHLLIDIARERAAKVLWHRDYGFPHGAATYGQIYDWVSTHPNRDVDKKMKALWKDLEKEKHGWLIEKSLEYLYNKEELCLKLLPLDVSDKTGFLFNSKSCEKQILMSATIGKPDIKALGLQNKRVMYIQAESPIPPEMRPLYFDPVGYISYANREESPALLANYIRETLRLNKEKGFIHAPYNLAVQLKTLLRDEPRLMFHTKDDKKNQYDAFYCSPVEEGKVLVASGLYEGISIDGDVGRWQLICKVPFKSLADPAIKYKAEEEPDWYAWETIKTISQAYGRISRGPTDYGCTVLLDQCWEKLYRENKELIPPWLQEAMVT